MNIRLSAITALAAAALVAGCSLAPKYEQPALPVDQSYPALPPSTLATDAAATATQQSAPAANVAAAADIPWQDFYGDARLRAIIALTLENNRDLRVAALRVEQAQAQYQIQRSALFPAINASAAMTRQRIPGDLNTSGHAMTTNQFSVGGAASYEIDFFGRVRSLKDAALETYLATGEARDSARLSLVAAVATQYLFERALDEQYAIAQQTLKLVQDSLDLIQHRYDAGTASELDLASAKTQFFTTQASLADLNRQLAQARNALVLLAGAPLPAGLPAPKPLSEQGIVTDLPAGVPSDLLTRRPDILQAEYSLRAANANIGAARAAYFPSITLTAFAGTASVELDNLFKSGQFMWNFAPSINLPIFNAGKIKANLEVTKAAQKITVAQYEKAIQGAFQEVSDAIVARATYVDQIRAQQDRVNSEQRRYDLSNLRYQQGVDSYLNVLTAQQSLFSAQQGLVLARTAQLTNLVTLYKVLGGGWDKK